MSGNTTINLLTKGRITNMDLDMSFDEYADPTLIKEATAFPTFPTGWYSAQGGKVTQLKGENNSKDTAAALRATLMNGDKKMGGVSFFVRWKGGERRADGGLDGNSVLYGSLVKALFSSAKPDELAKKPVAEVMEAFLAFPIRLKLTESFKVEQDDGSMKWKSSVDKEVVAGWRGQGCEARNFVNRIVKES